MLNIPVRSLTAVIVCMGAWVLLWGATAAIASSSEGGTTPHGITVLLYHRFGDERYPSTNVSVGDLIDQMAYLRDNDYRVLDPRQFDEIMDGVRPPGPRDVLITVDDGYRSFVEKGYPVFRRFGFPVLVFLSTESIERGYGDMMSWADVETLLGKGVGFGNHSHSHLHTGRRDLGESPEHYDERLRQDTLKARELLNAHGIEDVWYAYPYGEWTPRFERVLDSLGFHRTFSQNPGVAQARVSPGPPVPRMAIVGASVPVEEFAAKLFRLPLEATLLDPPDGWTSPSVSAIRIEIAGLGDWGTGEVNVFLSEKGRLSETVSGERVTVEPSSPILLSRPLNRIIVSARERATGRYRMKSWLLLFPEEQPRKVAPRSSPATDQPSQRQGS